MSAAPSTTDIAGTLGISENLHRRRNGLSLPVLDMRQTIFKGHYTTVNNEKLSIRRAVPVLLRFLIRRTFVPGLGCRHIGKFNQDDTFERSQQLQRRKRCVD